MKTIEERATEYVMPLVDDHSEGSLMTIRLAYMHGAKDQKKIDDDGFNEGKALLYAVNKTAERTKKDMINKACKWLKRNLDEYIEINIKYGETTFEFSDDFYNDFKKAMEE